jgi:hypothetical protein
MFLIHQDLPAPVPFLESLTPTGPVAKPMAENSQAQAGKRSIV